MKSTIRIALESQGHNLQPVIKIIQPTSTVKKDCIPSVESEDEAPNDALIANFLHSPLNVDRNYWFALGTYYPVPFDYPTHHVSNIEAVKESDLFYRFKHAIINRLIPYGDIIKINRGETPEISTDPGIRKAERIDLSVDKHNKIEEFFKWVEETGYCSWDEQQSTDLDGRPRN